MKLVADENIPLVRELFADFGELSLYPGRAISADTVRDADALLVRSVTKVDQALVAGSRLRFVGTATIGTDHVDQAALAAQGIGFANAPGCNATAVAEYVLASLLVLAERGKYRPGQDVIGILGHGNVGSRLAAKLAALDWPFRVCDPLLPATSLPGGGVSAEQLLACDVLTLHVPLSKAGAHSTWHWLSSETLTRSRARVIINSCRGPVVDNEALLSWLNADVRRAAVLDVWEHEPDVPDALLAKVDLATPHIAGHSREGKLNGSFMIHAAFCRQFGFDASGATRWQLPPAGQGSLVAESAPQQLLNQLLQCYDPRHDDTAMRGALSAAEDRRAAFDWLRKHYPERRELMSWQFQASAALAARYQALTGLVVG